MQGNTQNEPLTFGFNVGIASVGWAVLSPTRIIDLGVRCFEIAETAGRGESLNLPRRMARLKRRRLRRRACRLTKLAKLLRREELIPQIKVLKQAPAKGFKTPNLWQLRVEALDRQLTSEEWARVIYHLCKHRGFHWMSKAEERKVDEDQEIGAVKKALAGNKKLMGGNKYLTAAQMILAEYPNAQRNKRGEYNKALSREQLAVELKTLFESQRQFLNPHTSAALESAILGNGDKKTGIFWEQKPALSGEALLIMLGKCAFEKSEYRAPKVSFSAERRVWLTRLNNLRIVVDGKTRELTGAERTVALLRPYLQIGDFSYRQLGDALVKAGLLREEQFKFSGLFYPSAKQKEEESARNPENHTLISLQGWQTLRSALTCAGLEEPWQKLSIQALEGKPELMDEIARVLTVYKEDDEVLRELGKLDLPNKNQLIDILLSVRFDEFSNLSLKALYKILPHMEAGLRYDEACKKAQYHQSELQGAGESWSKYLPPFYSGRDKDGRMIFGEGMDIPRNPVGLRALNQARKVCNALIRQYGPPHEIHIEMAKDLSKSFDERKNLNKAQKTFQERNESAWQRFISERNMDTKPNGRDFEKYLLYLEQLSQCAYSQKEIERKRLFESGYTEIDHVLPRSRSFDNSRNNKVLVLTKENQNKGNLTPFEYFNFLDGVENGPRWQKFEKWVAQNSNIRQAKRARLLNPDFGNKDAQELRDRNINDTRYVCKFFKNYIERYLKLQSVGEAHRCTVLNGKLTASLRARWGLFKVHTDSDRHQALNAAVVAACSYSMIKKLSDYSRHKELVQVDNGSVDMLTGEVVNPAMLDRLELHFPTPWPHFRPELEAHLQATDAEHLRSALKVFGSYPENSLQALRPLFVSRAPQRRQGGALHAQMLRSPKLVQQMRSHKRIAIQELKVRDLDKIHGADDPRNHALIEVLRARLLAADGDGKKAFADPVYKPTSPGKVAPQVRTVKLIKSQSNGAVLNHGQAIADLGDMLSVNIYERPNSYFIEPVYGMAISQRIASQEVPSDAIFSFSLTRNDFVKITFANIEIAGYFVMYESDGRMTLRAHDQPKVDKQYFRRAVSSAKRIEKFNVDILGNIYPAPKKTRSGPA